MKNYADYVAKCSGLKRTPMSKADWEQMDDEKQEKALKALEGQGPPQPDPEEEDDEEDEDDDEDDDEGGELQRSQQALLDLGVGPTEMDLEKAMRQVRDAAAALPATARQDRLAQLSKAAAAGTLTADNRREMLSLLAADEGGGVPVSGQLRKSLETPEAQAAVDASDYLMILSEALTKGFTGLEGEIRSRFSTQERFFGALAQGLDAFSKSVAREMADLRKALAGKDEQIATLSGRLEQVERTPLPWRSQVSPPAPRVEKSQIQPGPRDGAPIDELSKAAGLTKKQAASALFSLMEKSEDPAEKDRLGDLVIEVENCPGDWRKLITDPELLKQVVSAQ